MGYYLYRLNPPRATFAQDMTPAEADVMRHHVAYWSGLLAQVQVIAFGHVADPAGAYGIGILRLDPEADPHLLDGGDPAIQSKLGFSYEIHPMPMVVHG